MRSSVVGRLPALLFLTIAVCLAAGLSALLAAQKSHGAEPVPASITAVAHFSALKDAPVGTASNPFAHTPGVDANQARQLTVGGRPAWVVANADDVCLMVQSAIDKSLSTGGCAAAAVAEAQGLFTWSKPAPAAVASGAATAQTSEVAALVPDGVSSVRFGLSDGSSRTVSVSSNVASAVLAQAPTEARFTDAAGATQSTTFHHEG
jgi:hypothetical protein